MGSVAGGNPDLASGYHGHQPSRRGQFVHPRRCGRPEFHRTEGALPEVTLSIYTDITTPPVWDGDTVCMLDLDLDVIQTLDGRVLVVDEDEFAENQVSYGYPEELIALARTSCDDVAAAMRARMEPYRSVGWSWLPQTPS